MYIIYSYGHWVLLMPVTCQAYDTSNYIAKLDKAP